MVEPAKRHKPVCTRTAARTLTRGLRTSPRISGMFHTCKCVASKLCHLQLTSETAHSKKKKGQCKTIAATSSFKMNAVRNKRVRVRRTARWIPSRPK